MGYILATGFIFSPFVAYPSVCQKVFQDAYGTLRAKRQGRLPSRLSRGGRASGRIQTVCASMTSDTAHCSRVSAPGENLSTGLRQTRKAVDHPLPVRLSRRTTSTVVGSPLPRAALAQQHPLPGTRPSAAAQRSPGLGMR